MKTKYTEKVKKAAQWYRTRVPAINEEQKQLKDRSSLMQVLGISCLALILPGGLVLSAFNTPWLIGALSLFIASGVCGAISQQSKKRIQFVDDVNNAVWDLNGDKVAPGELKGKVIELTKVKVQSKTKSKTKSKIDVEVEEDLTMNTDI